MTDQIIANNIREIINTFNYFIDNYENDLKTKLSLDEIKDHFKAAIFVEKTMRNMQEKGISEQFITCLNTTLEKNNRTLFYGSDFYDVACDYVLLKYFNGKKYDIDIAIRMYTSSCDENRFGKVIAKFILESGRNDIVLKYFIENKNDVNSSELESRLLLNSWKHEIEIGKFDDVKKNIEIMFESYKINKYLPLLIQILLLNNISDQETSIKSIILKLLLNQMKDRSALSKDFWITLIKTIEKKSLLRLSIIFPNFLSALLKFLVHCGCLMSCEILGGRKVFFGNPIKSICPEITYEDIFDVVGIFLSDTEVQDFTKNYLEEARVSTNSIFWKEFNIL